MKKAYKLASLLIMSCVLAACGSYAKTSLPASFVGEITVVSSERVGDDVDIVLHIDGGSWYKAPTWEFHDVKSQVNGKSIYISFRVKGGVGVDVLPDQKVRVKNAAPGNYYLQYKNPDNVIKNITSLTL